MPSCRPAFPRLWCQRVKGETREALGPGHPPSFSRARGQSPEAPGNGRAGERAVAAGGGRLAPPGRRAQWCRGAGIGGTSGEMKGRQGASLPCRFPTKALATLLGGSGGAGGRRRKRRGCSQRHPHSGPLHPQEGALGPGPARAWICLLSEDGNPPNLSGLSFPHWVIPGIFPQPAVPFLVSALSYPLQPPTGPPWARDPASAPGLGRAQPPNPEHCPLPPGQREPSECLPASPEGVGGFQAVAARHGAGRARAPPLQTVS